MRDGPARAAIKTLARWVWSLEIGVRRSLLRLRGEPAWVLGGGCGSCALCCDNPSIAVGRLVWFLPTLRRAFVAWQRVVNGFVLVRAEREGRALVFRCTHLEPVTRRCDSYSTRPGMCRDYPRLLLYQPWPDFFEGCGHRPIQRSAEGLARALDQTELSEEQRAELRRRLMLE